MFAALASALVLAIAPQDGPPDAPAQEQPAGQLDDVLVDGRRLEDAARAFIEEVGAPPPGTRPGRWNSEICVSVTGMQPRFAQLMIDQIARRALDVGVDVEAPGCRPNVIILATDDGRALASSLVEDAGLGFQPAHSSTNLTRSALRRFRTSRAPVRWWHVTIPVLVATGEPAIAFKGQPAPTVTVRDASRLRSNIRYDIGWVVIVIDMSRTGNASFGALSDYVAFATLTQLDATADTSRDDTILNLFEENRQVTGLTDWDRDYLSALYTSRTDRATVGQQLNDLVRSLTDIRRSSVEAGD